MNKFVKGALMFTGGVAGVFVLCGITTIKFVVKSNTFRTALKNKISEEVTTLLYGKGTRRDATGYKVSYRDYYTGREIKPGCGKGILLETRKDAEDVLSAVEDVFEAYGLVTVADLCDLCSVTSKSTKKRKEIGDHG